MLRINNDFSKKIRGASCHALKCKPTLLPPNSAGAREKSRIYLQRFVRQNERWYAYLEWSIFYVGCYSQLLKCIFDSCLTKYPILALQKWKMHFLWKETENVLHGIPPIPRATYVFNMGFFFFCKCFYLKINYIFWTFGFLNFLF
jgi:hypothetical protein